MVRHLMPRRALGLMLLLLAAGCRWLDDPALEVTWREWTGQYGGPAEPRVELAATTAEWYALWRLVGAAAPPDFVRGGQTGVGIFLGERPTGGYAVRVLGVERRPDRLLVTWTEETPPPEAMVTQAFTAPYAILLINRGDLPVAVERR